jgi:hypothetical protein
VAGTLALGAVLLALLIAWLTGAFKATARRKKVGLGIALLIGGNLALVLNNNAALGALGIALISGVVVLVRLRPRADT